MSYRLDISTLRPPEKRADGSLIVEAHLTRAGVFHYRNPDGTLRREYRPPAEVFKPESVATFRMVPVTNDHPPAHVPRTTETWSKYSVGAVGSEIRQDGVHLAAALAIHDKRAVEEILAGKVEVSCGYEVDEDRTPGVSPEGEPYDLVQRNIRGDHVAIVRAGRAGTARIRMDAAVQWDSTKEVVKMDELQDKLAKALASVAELQVRADVADKRADGAEKKIAQLEGERDAEKARADKAERSRDDAAAQVESKVRARVELETRAKNVLGTEDLSKASDRDIKTQVISKLDGIDVSADKSNEYVDAFFDRAMELSQKADQALGQARVTVYRGDKAGAIDTVKVAREKMIEANLARGRAPLKEMKD